MAIRISDCEGFEWDKGNRDKNWIRHRVSKNKCEEVFFNQPILVSEDPKHSNVEKRYYVLGRTDSNRFLFISFTIRNNRIRVISARDMNRKERKAYHEQIEKRSNV
ncbi:MAG: BrnT family toxin [Candidatus Marinimicrobia bacterium]|nr:BrnT family toxin [Candidatus Neomarinimicrobiota bacterium]